MPHYFNFCLNIFIQSFIRANFSTPPPFLLGKMLPSFCKSNLYAGDALQHFDSEIRWMALMKLMTFHELPTYLGNAMVGHELMEFEGCQNPGLIIYLLFMKGTVLTAIFYSYSV